MRFYSDINSLAGFAVVNWCPGDIKSREGTDPQGDKMENLLTPHPPSRAPQGPAVRKRSPSLPEGGKY